MEKSIEEKILDLVKKSPQTISSIKRALNLDYKNAWRYCRKLYNNKTVDLLPPPDQTKKGKPVYVLLHIDSTEKDYILKILEEIKKRGGRINSNEYSTLFLKDTNYAKRRIIFSALLKLPYIAPDLIIREYVLTKAGEEYLKKHSGGKIKNETINNRKEKA